MKHPSQSARRDNYIGFTARWRGNSDWGAMKAQLVVLFLCVLIAKPAWADIEWVIPVVQPVVSESGLVPCVTTYSAYFSPEEEAIARIELTVSPNCIMQGSGQPVDRNAAVDEKIGFAAIQRADTLFVVVDVSLVVLPPAGDASEWLRTTREETVAMTLWCGLRNARGAWPKARYVKYNLVGNRELSRYSGTYSLDSIIPPTTRTVFDMKSFGPLSR